MKFFKMFLPVATLILAGCSAPAAPENNTPPTSDSTFSGSCDTREMLGYCYNYEGWNEEDAREECAGSPGGIFSTEKCPEADVIARCHFTDGLAPITYVFSAPATLDQAKASCPGDFMPN